MIRNRPPHSSASTITSSSSSSLSSSFPRQASPPRASVLKRADSLPAHLPSGGPERAEVGPARHPITRPLPDSRPPAHFNADGDLLAASHAKYRALKESADHYEFLLPLVGHDAEFMDILRSRHPDFRNYDTARKAECCSDLLMNHPRYAAKLAKARNVLASIPSGATSTRTMRPMEQKFLTRAFRKLKERFQAEPFRIHGETAIIGNRRGKIVQVDYAPRDAVASEVFKGERFHLHTHPPYGEPFASSASKQDHLVSAEYYGYENNKMNFYVTNGKDALHIPPDSTELVKLVPDPKWYGKLGEFPVAFALPEPQRPPYPFANHEAPASSKPGEGGR